MTRKLNFLCIGYLSRTEIVSGGIESVYIGGPSLNVSRVLGTLGYNVGMVSPFGPEIDEDEIDGIKRFGIDTSGLWRADRTFQVIIDKDNPPPLVVSISDYITSDRIPSEYRVIPNVYLGPVISEISNETILRLFEQMPNSRFFLDAQGYTRKFQGNMMPDEVLTWSDRGEIIGNLDVVKLNDKELELVMGSDTPEDMRELGSTMKEGSVLIVTRGQEGSSVYKDGVIMDIEPVTPREVIDTTCAGDSYMGAFLSEYCRHGNHIEAARFASSYSSYVVEHVGFVAPCA